ncbi:unnamed protein product, partial [Rotaria sp. Silwood2]
MVGKQRDNQQSLLDLSTIALGIWCDKIFGYRFPQAIGPDDIPINQKCPISKDLSQLEKASSNLPKCGDGEDNSSVKASFGAIKSKLTNEKIIFDTIAFMKHESSNLVQLCEATKGFYYINVPYDKMEMAKLFEREASLM